LCWNVVNTSDNSYLVVYLAIEILSDRDKLLDAVSVVELKGKYKTSSGLKNDSLGEYFKIVARVDNFPGWYFLNADSSTFVSYYMPGIPKEESSIILEIARFKKQLNNMGSQVRLKEKNETLIMSSTGKTSKIGTWIEHPHSDMITTFSVASEDIWFSRETDTLMKWGGQIEFKSNVQMHARKLKSAMKACESISDGTYSFRLLAGDLIVSSNSHYESYSEKFENVGSGDDASVQFTGPIHQAFSNEEINIHFNNDELIVIVSPTAKVVRAPVVETGD
jgi:hypothetical protein